jgi:hypothetical protein
MRAVIKIASARKKFSQSELDCFRRIVNVLHSHDLSACIKVKDKVDTVYNARLKVLS